MITNIKKHLYKIYSIRKLKEKIAIRLSNLKNGIKINNKGCYKFQKNLKGKNNSVIIGENSFIDNAGLLFNGDNNQLIIGNNCYIGPDCRFRLEGNNTIIIIGDNTSATRKIEFCCQEDNSTIKIGNGCMFANRIVIRTSDTHPIYEITTKERINHPGNVQIGNHVWIAPNCKIMKNSVIPDGCIIGSDTTISKKIEEENCLIVGRPAKIIKRNVYWTKDNMF